MSPVTRRVALASLMVAGALSAHAQQSYPSKPIQLVVPFAAGGSADVMARLIAQQLAPRLGQPVVVENRTGAGGTVAATAVARATPDGHTLLLVAAGHAGSKAMYPQIPYDPVKGFAPVAGLVSYPVVLLVKPESRYQSIEMLAADIQSNPGKFNNANPGPSTVPGLSAELFKRRYKLDFTSVPYRGSSPALNAVLAGETEFAFIETGSAMALLKGGKLRGLAIMHKERLPELPDVPSIDETRLAGTYTSAWLGVLAPAGTPAAVVERLNAEVGQIMQSASIKERMRALGGVSLFDTSTAFGAHLGRETERWSDLIKVLGLKPE